MNYDCNLSKNNDFSKTNSNENCKITTTEYFKNNFFGAKIFHNFSENGETKENCKNSNSIINDIEEENKNKNANANANANANDYENKNKDGNEYENQYENENINENSKDDVGIKGPSSKANFTIRVALNGRLLNTVEYCRFHCDNSICTDRSIYDNNVITTTTNDDDDLNDDNNNNKYNNDNNNNKNNNNHDNNNKNNNNHDKNDNFIDSKNENQIHNKNNKLLNLNDKTKTQSFTESKNVPQDNEKKILNPKKKILQTSLNRKLNEKIKVNKELTFGFYNPLTNSCFDGFLRSFRVYSSSLRLLSTDEIMKKRLNNVTNTNNLNDFYMNNNNTKNSIKYNSINNNDNNNNHAGMRDDKNEIISECSGKNKIRFFCLNSNNDKNNKNIKNDNISNKNNNRNNNKNSNKRNENGFIIPLGQLKTKNAVYAVLHDLPLNKIILTNHCGHSGQYRGKLINKW